MQLKKYQENALEQLNNFLLKAKDTNASLAFMQMKNLPYRHAASVERETPYVCIKVPTGGGKTLLASHAIVKASESFLQTSIPFVLWLVPSSAILEQTLKSLKNIHHPYRQALSYKFQNNIKVINFEEALTLSHADATGGAIILVSTIQAFKRENEAILKVYGDAGNLMEHFTNCLPLQLASLEMKEGFNRPLYSLANAIRLHRPMVIIDEAHNNRTPLSFETLSRLAPSLIIEFSATPKLDGDDASNILYDVSASDLKAQQMIKMPIRLLAQNDWKLTIGSARDCQIKLEEAALEEEKETGEYIRPIVLFQAERDIKADPTKITAQKFEEYLLEIGIPKNQIRIATGKIKGLEGENLLSKTSQVRFIITQQALLEGWDCPFAYVLCSLANLSDKKSIEQLLGRVMRLPQAKWKKRDALNRAYAFVASDNFHTAATALKDALVEGSGFNPLAVDDLVKGLGELDLKEPPQAQYTSLSLENTVTPLQISKAFYKLPEKLQNRCSFEETSQQFIVQGVISKQDRNLMQMAFASVKGADKAIEDVFLKSNRFISAEIDMNLRKDAFLVPQLGYVQNGFFSVFNQEHYLDLPWDLEKEDAAKIVSNFSLETNSVESEIDFDKNDKIDSKFIHTLHQQLALIVHEPQWSLPKLINFLDNAIRHDDVTKPAAKIFFKNGLEALINKGFSLDELVRFRFRLKEKFEQLVKEFRVTKEALNYTSLFALSHTNFKTSSELPHLFDEMLYDYNQPYQGSHRFQKHYFNVIGDLKSKGEEFECALMLDMHPNVKFWVRNVDRKPNAFWLKMPHGKFYPDFVVRLNDGRTVIIEYKGLHLSEDAKDKKTIGECWANASDGSCLFIMPTGIEDLKKMNENLR